MPKITAKIFKESTGYEPYDDMLERVNCPKAGEFGHKSCGWCHECDCPMFSCICKSMKSLLTDIFVINAKQK